MYVKVLLFAGLAERAGTRELSIKLEEGARIGDLIQCIKEEYPALQPLLSSCFVSVNQEYAVTDYRIQVRDEVAILPPVSGGEEVPLFLVTHDPLQINTLLKLVSNPRSGAIFTFVGTVRKITYGKRTVSLSYEAYEGMSEQKMQQIANEIKEHWPDCEVAMHHRIGELGIEDIAVIIAVSSSHRNESFEAGRYAIERLKQIVPIWKKERWEDGSEWQGHQQGPWNPTGRTIY